MAQIISPERGHASGGAGLSYMIGTKIFDQPLLMPISGANQLKTALDSRVFDSPAGLVALAPRMNAFAGTDTSRSRYRVTDDGIAIVPIAGMLFDRGDWLGTLGGFATSYEGLAEQFRRIAKDSTIKAVILDIDSGGGMAAGCFDLCAEMSALRKVKKVYAIAQNDACSGAYAIAASAHETYVTSLGRAGSIGVVSIHMSYQRMLDQSGIDTTIIHSGQHKPNGNPYQPLSHTARGEMVATVDQITTTFVKHVAKARGLDEDVVRGFEAATFNGPKAVEAGLADGVKTFAELVTHISKGNAVRGHAVSPSSTTMRARSPSSTGDRAMPDENMAVQAPDYEHIIATALSMIAATQPRGAISATVPAVAAPVAAPVVAAPVVTPVVAASAAVNTDDRIWAIMDCEAAKTRPGLAKHLAKNTTVSALDASAILAAAPAESGVSAPAATTTQTQLGNALERRMMGVGASAGVRPEGGAGGGGSGPTSISDYSKNRVAARAGKR